MKFAIFGNAEKPGLKEALMVLLARLEQSGMEYALDDTLDLRGATKSQIERAMQGHVLANTELIGTYQKGDR